MAAGKTRASSLIGIRSLHICVNVRFGSLAAPLVNISLMSASGGNADVRTPQNLAKLGSAFGQKRSVNPLGPEGRTPLPNRRAACPVARYRPHRSRQIVDRPIHSSLASPVRLPGAGLATAVYR